MITDDGDLCPVFFPRSAGFYSQNFFREGTLTDAERSCAIACVQATSPYMAALLTSPLQDTTPGCPPIAVEGCEVVTLGQECEDRIEALLDPTTVGDIVEDVCGQTIQPPIGPMTRQYFANLLNLCICAQGAQGPVGGVDLNDTVNLNRLPEPTRTDAIAIFSTATPSVQQVLAEAERILDLFCDTGTVDPNADTMNEVLTAMAQEGTASIIEPA